MDTDIMTMRDVAEYLKFTDKTAYRLAAERMEELSPFEPVTYPRAHPLADGETRERDEDLDPQIIWKGATLSLTPEQIE